MDEWAHRFANALVGNDENEATLEITLTGPTLRFDTPATDRRLRRRPVATGRRRRRHAGACHTAGRWIVEAGSQLRFGARVAGARAYLAVRGGFDVPLVMGSRSTYVRGGFGGLEGRALRKGDVLRIAPAPARPLPGRIRGHLRGRAESRRRERGLGARLADPVGAGVAGDRAGARSQPRADRSGSLPAVTGTSSPPQARRLLLEPSFASAPSPTAWDTGWKGRTLARARPIEMISEAVTFGTVQVPPDGKPIILMADRQTTGGYPKIASVASVDLPSWPRWRRRRRCASP